MNKSDNGGPAFPSSATKAVMGRDGSIEPSPFEFGGMSLRDWFAGQALAGLAQTYSAAAFRDQWVLTFADVAKNAYDYADAMLAARKGTAE